MSGASRALGLGGKQLVTVKPAEKATGWRLVIKAPSCALYEAKLYGYRLYGVRWSKECLWSLVETGMLECIGDCTALRDCRNYILGSGSLVARCRGSVTKLYLVQPSNPEAELLALLDSSRLVPGITARLVYRGETIGIVEEELDGKPLAVLAQKELKNHINGLELVEVLPLAARILAAIHKWLGPVQRECRLELGKRATWYLERLPRSLAGELATLYTGLTGAERVDTSLAMCQLVHQDPHLYQFIVTDNGIALIDFSGEPLRAPISGPYELPLRDVAVLLRSASYIATTTIKNTRSTDRKNLPNRVVEWLEHSVYEALETYLAHNVLEDPGAVLSLLSVLVVERLVYEVWYEYLYGTGLLNVVLAALHDPRLLPELGAFLHR